jgi:diacylglycerol kinase (ATP)
MGHRVVVVVNRRARLLASDGPLLAALRRPREGVRVLETTSLPELDQAAQEITREAAEVVVLAGGDGSYMAGVTALARASGGADLPLLALSPGGTASTVARNWGFRGGRFFDREGRDAAAYAGRLVDAAARGEAERIGRPTLRVTDASGSARVGFIVGAGLVSRFFEIYEREGARGERGAAAIVARIFASSLVGGALARRVLEPVPCSIEVDGRAASFRRASLACASVVRDLGLGMRLPYRAGERLDRFHFVATPLGPGALGPQMPLVLAGRPLLGDRVDALAGRVVVRFEGGGAYVLDGELIHAEELVIESGPTVRVLRL